MRRPTFATYVAVLLTLVALASVTTLTLLVIDQRAERERREEAQHVSERRLRGALNEIRTYIAESRAEREDEHAEMLDGLNTLIDDVTADIADELERSHAHRAQQAERMAEIAVLLGRLIEQGERP